jgi:uncharacterized membrane protein YGL010W
MSTSFFTQQLGIYASYHRDPRNRATHFIGIPAIVFSLLVPLALWRFTLFGSETSAAFLVAFVALGGWVALDRTVGAAMILPVAVMLAVAEAIARSTGATVAWIVFAVFFVGGWAFQIVGHVWEGRRPALMDNLFQGYIGPMFIMAEFLMALGFKHDLKAALDAAAAKPGD